MQPMYDYERFFATDFIPALIVGQWVSVVEDVSNILIYIVVSVCTKVIINLIERKEKNAYNRK